ncbi:MAG: hypothetical protein ACHP9Y_05085 [Gammaproteobacteria bacterium]
MMQLVIIIILCEVFILSLSFSIWFGIKHFAHQRRQKNAGKIIRNTWLNQQHLYGEVLRKRLAALYQVEGEALAAMVDAVLEREQVLINRLSICVAYPEPQRLTELLHYINRHGDVYSQLASNNNVLKKAAGE